MGIATSALRFDLFARDRTGPGVNSAESSFSRLGKNLGKGLAVGVAGGVAALGVLGKASFDAASELQQSLGAVDSVFGKSAEKVNKWAADSANSLGLASSEYSNLSALLGSQLTNMGRSQGQAAKQSDNLITLGADLAATYGGSVADAVSAVSSVLKGETDPIERYGVSIKQADISARLAAQGQDKLTGTAKKQATATAALALLTEQSTKAQGAFGRESNTVAGQQARFAANVENLKAKLGSALLPVMTKVFGFLNAKAVPAVSNLITNLRSGDGGFAKFRNGLRAVGSFITGTIVPALQRFGDWFTTKGWPAIKAFAQGLWTSLQPAIQAIGTAFRDDIQPAIQNLIAKFKEAWPNIQRFGAILVTIGQFILTKVVPVLVQFTGKYLAAVIRVFGQVFASGWKVINFLIDLGKAVGQAGAAYGRFVAAVVGHMARFYKAVFDGIGKAVGFIKDLPGKAVSAVGNLGSTLLSVGADLIEGFLRGIRNKAGDIGSTIKNSVTDKIPGWIKKPLGISSPSKLTMKYGKWFVEGFAIGVKDNADMIQDKIQGLVDKLKTKLDAVKDFARGIRDQFKMMGDLTSIDTMVGDREGGLPALLSGLRKQTQDAQAFASAMTALRKAGLNDSSLANLRDAGPSGGLKAAQQLLSGGGAAIGEVNSLTKMLNASGKAFAGAESKAMYGFSPYDKSNLSVKAGGQKISLSIDGSGDELTEAIVKALRKKVRKNGGNVELVLGSSGKKQ